MWDRRMEAGPMGADRGAGCAVFFFTLRIATLNTVAELRDGIALRMVCGYDGIRQKYSMRKMQREWPVFFI